jgi:pimeloyl-ACP methyl ester carboxylesterase
LGLSGVQGNTCVPELHYSKSTIVLVHGLWNRGWTMMAMAKRLKARGHNVAVYSYPTRDNCLDGHANGLHAFVNRIKAEEVHLVGHSMGGLVILNMLSRFDDLPPGRVVLMGTPVKGSSVVKRLEKLPGQKLMFGKARENLLQGFAHSPQERETGMIRGTRALGLGRMTGKHDEPSDGAVAVSETEMGGLKDSIDLEVAHTQMLVSAKVVAQVEQFLLSGEFKKDGHSPVSR